MNIYALGIYGIFVVAMCLSIASFAHTLRIFAATTMKNVVLICISLIIAFVPFGKYSLSMWLYSLFGFPSFLLALVCILTIARGVFRQVNLTIHKQGMLFLFLLWILFVCNTLGYIDWFLGTISYRIFVVGIVIAIGYYIDKVCGLLMLASFLIWIPCATFIDVYNALFDSVICVGCVFIQSIPMRRNNFHIALLKPKFS